MQREGSRILAIATIFAIAVICTGGGITANAQFVRDNYYPPTPSQGPPTASGNSFITIDTFITPEIYNRIDRAIHDNNRCYSLVKAGAAQCLSDLGVDDNDRCVWGCTKNGVFISRPTSAAIITVTKKRYSPWMSQTQYPDRPNEFAVLTSYFFIYNLSSIWGCSGVCFDYPFSRTVSQSLDLYTTCSGWQTGTGGLVVTSVLAPAYMDQDHSIVEDTLFGILWNNVIPGVVDSKIRSALSTFGAGSTVKPLGSTDSSGVFHPMQCNRLGVSAFSDAPNLESINFDFLNTIRIAGLFSQQISVRVTQVRRLMLHDRNGYVVRYPTEYPRLELYAGYSQLVLNLPPMMEGQTYFPTSTAAISTGLPPLGQLVLIANMWDTSHYTRDPGYIVFNQSQNWGAGTRILNTPKIWSEFDPLFRKPIIMRASGYEVTLQITPPSTVFTTTTTTF